MKPWPTVRLGEVLVLNRNAENVQEHRRGLRSTATISADSPFHRILQDLKGRNNFVGADGPPLQGGTVCFGTLSWGFTPGYPMAGLRPCNRVAESIPPLAEPRRPAETAVELDALGPARRVEAPKQNPEST